MARVELGEGGTVLLGKEGFFLGYVEGLKVEDRVERPGSDGCIHILSVQLLPGHLGVLDCSIVEEILYMGRNFSWSVFFLFLRPESAVTVG